MGLLHAMLSKRTIITFVYLDLVLSKLNSLSKLFQNKKVTLNMAILATKDTIIEFSELGSEQSLVVSEQSRID